MKDLVGLTADAVQTRIAELESQLSLYKHRNLALNMARGKPSKEQLDLSNDLFSIQLPATMDPMSDLRNYGNLQGLHETRVLFGEVLGVSSEQVIVGGNSSLTMMYDTLAKAVLYGLFNSEKPWKDEMSLKFICPVPGYDRHFTICESLGIEMIPIPLLEDGPDMDLVEKLVKEDSSIKGMWCVPKYANPSGISYSSDTIKRLASIETAAKDFTLIWDNAYTVHDLYEDKFVLDSIMEACETHGHPHRPLLFTSFSKVTFAGAAVAAMAGSTENIQYILKLMGDQTIGSDKINQYRHATFLKNHDGLMAHMKRHGDILRPKFELVLERLNRHFPDSSIATWSEPKGGYFISLDVHDSSAKEVVSLAKENGLVLTEAGATFPYGKDPNDSNIRIAPSFPSMEELEVAIELLCVCIELVYLKHNQ